MEITLHVMLTVFLCLLDAFCLKMVWHKYNMAGKFYASIIDTLCCACFFMEEWRVLGVMIFISGPLRLVIGKYILSIHALDHNKTLDVMFGWVTALLIYGTTMAISQNWGEIIFLTF